MKDAIEIGAHRAWVEGDVMRLIEQGLVSLSEMKVIVGLLRRWQAEKGVQYALIDIRRLLPMEPEVKKYLTHEFKTIRLRAVLGIGASPVVRMTTNLIVKALETLGYQGVPVITVRDEAEGLAWIEQDRMRHSAAARG